MSTENEPRLKRIDQNNPSNNLQVRLTRRALGRNMIGLGFYGVIGGGMAGMGTAVGSEELVKPREARSKKILGESAASIVFGAGVILYKSIMGKKTFSDSMDGLEDAIREDERKRNRTS